MPIVKISGKLVYFAHVPKCAGTAIEIYLAKAFGPLAFHDVAFNRHSPRSRWSRSSPQHVDADTLWTLFPSDFFDTSFAVVRSPITRIVSAFRFQRDIESSIDPDTSLGDWLEVVHGKRRRTRWQFDNHTRQMIEIVPEDAHIFRLEQGLDAVATWLQTLVDPDHILPAHIKSYNVLDRRLAFEGKPIKPVIPNADEIALVARYYSADFERFGYDPETGDFIP